MKPRSANVSKDTESPDSPVTKSEQKRKRASAISLRGRAKASAKHDQPHAKRGPDSTSIPLESIGSLIRRLGPPPPDLAEHLVRQFRSACSALANGGESIHEVDLEAWRVSDQGKIVPSESHPPGSGKSSSGRASESGPVLDPDALADQFRQFLTVPLHGTPRITDALPETTNHFRRAALRANRTVKEEDTSHLSASERENRDRIVKLLSSSLAERFGNVPTEEPTEQPRPAKPQPIERDRPFNWNLVLAIGTTVVILAVALIGFQVAKRRQQKTENGMRSAQPTHFEASRTTKSSMESPTPAAISDASTDGSTGIDQSQTVVESSAENQTQEVDSGIHSPISEPLPVPESTSESTKIDSPAPRSGDILDDLESFMNGFEGEAEPEWSRQDAMDTGDSLSFAMSNDISIDIRPVIPAKSQTPTSATESATPDRLDPIFESEDAVAQPPESPQQIRLATPLLATKVTDQTTQIETSKSPLQRIEFPISVPIEFSKQAAETPGFLVNTKSGNRIAEIDQKGEIAAFRWTENARREATSAQVIHGRLVDADNGNFYLRPSIQADPFLLSLENKDLRPTWGLGGPILPRVSQLQIDLFVPDSIDLAWLQPSNEKPGTKGMAVAVLTPPDGETVAIAIQFMTRCSSAKLSCTMQYRARIAPSLPWHPFTRAGLEASQKNLAALIKNIERSRAKYDRELAESDLMMQPLLRRKRPDFEKMESERLASRERLAMLSILADQMETSVGLDLHLFVNWQDGPQTILRTQAPEVAEKPAAAP